MLISRLGRPPSLLALLGYAAATCGAALVGGHFTRAVTITEFYAGLVKPEWAPPGWVFGPVWTALYVCMALAVWLVWRQRWTLRSLYAAAMTQWWTQLVLNAAWPVVFWLQPAGLAPFLVCGLLALNVWGCVLRFRPISGLAAVLMFPYALWVSFATVLSGALWLLNKTP